MTSLQTPLTVLQASARRDADLPALKVPQHLSSELKWKDVTFAQFLHDVETCARHWTQQFTSRGWKKHSVVGLWLKGTAYSDVVHIWGIMRAGLVPQLISLRMSSPAVIYELLRQSHAVALIYEPSFESVLSDSPLAIFPAKSDFSQGFDQDLLSELWTPTTPDDVVIIIHTSGTTSGRPKLVHLTARWFTSVVDKMHHFINDEAARGGQQVVVAAGSFCHVASIMLLTALNHRSACLLLPTAIPYPSPELVAMVQKCGLTDLNTFSPILSRICREARQDASLLAVLQGLNHIVYGGVALDAADAEWGRRNGLRLVEVFASTEVGVMLQSRAASTAEPTLQQFPGVSYEFLPLSEGPDSGQQLRELVVLPQSPDCPHPSLRNQQTGKFHTGDLFVQVGPNEYVAKGRSDDWIKMEMALRCDAGSLERNALETCGRDLIEAAVVIGTGRPSPVLVVEPRQGAAEASQDGERALLSNDILQRIKPFQAMRYTHERIDSERFIVVVPRASLPRTATKGSIQRKMVEAAFQERLDAIFSAED